MDRQTLIYFAIVLGAIFLITATMQSRSAASSQPVVSLSGSSGTDQAAYWVNQASKIDWQGIGNAINTIWGDDKKP